MEYWSANGGLERFGYPISEFFYGTDPETGEQFYMQWFERARFESHPENKAPYDVLLGLLGKQLRGSGAGVSGGTGDLPAPKNSAKINVTTEDIIRMNPQANPDDIRHIQYGFYAAAGSDAPIDIYYRSEMAKRGWVVDEPDSSSDGSSIMFQKGDQRSGVASLPITSANQLDALEQALPAVKGHLKVGDLLVILAQGPASYFKNI